MARKAPAATGSTRRTARSARAPPARLPDALSERDRGGADPAIPRCPALSELGRAREGVAPPPWRRPRQGGGVSVRAPASGPGGRPLRICLLSVEIFAWGKYGGFG